MEGAIEKLTININDKLMDDIDSKLIISDGIILPQSNNLNSMLTLSSSLSSSSSSSSSSKNNKLTISESNQIQSSSSASTASSSCASTSSSSSNTPNNIQQLKPLQQQQSSSLLSSQMQLSQKQTQQQHQQHQNNKYIFILNAFVNGFAQLKLSADKIDYEFIIEIYWSNETKTFVKRTFDDFVIFNRNLLEQFSQFFNDLKMNTSTGGLNKTNRRLASNNSNANSCNKDSKFINVNGLINTSNGAHLIPVLPAAKKPFWISHLKLAESREIELNTYVQKILKLPIKISHSSLVLQFFESQSSDPKPCKPKSFTNSMKIENSENGTDSMEDDRDFNDLDDDVDDVNSNNNIDVDFNNFDDEFIDNEDDINDEFIEDDDDDEDEEDDIDDNGLYTDDVTNLNSNGTNSNQKKLNSISKKRINREAGLWWDNADALNELTSSTSFDFGSKYNINSNNHLHHSQNIINEQNDYNYELETLKSLESILKNSDLFYSSTTATVTNTLSSDESKENKHDVKTSSKSDILVRRLSLS